MGSKLSDKMHLIGVISKKLLFYSKKLLFFGNISYQVHFVTKLRPHFWNLRKITDFLIPIKSYFEREKNSHLLSGFGQKKFHKNKVGAETTQNNEKRLFLFQSQISNPNPFLGRQDADSKITPSYVLLYEKLLHFKELLQNKYIFC